jgi:hypothetical protein
MSRHKRNTLKWLARDNNYPHAAAVGASYVLCCPDAHRYPMSEKGDLALLKLNAFRDERTSMPFRQSMIHISTEREKSWRIYSTSTRQSRVNNPPAGASARGRLGDGSPHTRMGRSPSVTLQPIRFRTSTR